MVLFHHLAWDEDRERWSDELSFFNQGKVNIDILGEKEVESILEVCSGRLGYCGTYHMLITRTPELLTTFSKDLFSLLELLKQKSGHLIEAWISIFGAYLHLPEMQVFNLSCPHHSRSSPSKKKKIRRQNLNPIHFWIWRKNLHCFTSVFLIGDELCSQLNRLLR